MIRRVLVSFTGLLFLSLAFAAAAQEKPYDQAVDHVYATIDGQDFYMDVFTPNGKARKDIYAPNDNGFGLGIVDVVSGAWHSDRGKIAEHEQAQMYAIFCARGYTVFAVRPGTRPLYTAKEMVEHIKRAIRYIKANAELWKVDPARLGIVGASAGGHLALLSVLTAERGDPNAVDPLLRQSTEVQAAAVFFPPTDFLDWPGKDLNGVAELIGDILFRGGAAGHSLDEVREEAAAISPRRLVRGNVPPILFAHGDADPLVPLQQSRIMVDALRQAGNEAELIVKEGGGHPWITIPFEIIQFADFMDKQLAGK